MPSRDKQLLRIEKKIADIKGRSADEVRRREVLRALYECKARVEHVEFI